MTTRYYLFDREGSLKKVDNNVAYLFERYLLTVTNDVICIDNDTKNIQNISRNSNVLRRPLIVSHKNCFTNDGKHYFYFYKNIGKPYSKIYESAFSTLPSGFNSVIPFYSLFHARVVYIKEDEVGIMDRYSVIRGYSSEDNDGLEVGSCYIFLLNIQDGKIVNVLYNTKNKIWLNRLQDLFL